MKLNTASSRILAMSLFLVLSCSLVPRRTSRWTTVIQSCGRRVSLVHRGVANAPFRLRSLSSASKAAEDVDSRESVVSRSKPPKIPLSAEQRNLIRNWREHPDVNPTLVFPTLLISSEYLQKWIQDPLIDPYVAKPSNWGFLYQVHPRIKQVQDFNETHKLLLLLRDENNDNVSNKLEGVALKTLQSSASGLEIEFGPDLEIPLTFRQLSFGYILNKLLPVSPPSAYEQIGHVAHFNLKEDHIPYGEIIGQVLRETNLSIDTVVNKIGEVKGDYRTYDLDVLAGPGNFETTVVEHGMHIRLSVADCYWSTRLSGERQELIRDIERPLEKQKNKELVVADVFCGVGAVCLLLAKNNPNCTILANDWNPNAIHYFKESIASNGFEHENQFQLSCVDAYDFMIELGTDRSAGEIPDHILMNFPLEAPSFLGALRWWSFKAVTEKFKSKQRYPRFHVYTFARSSSAASSDEEEVAVDLVANELLPDMAMGCNTMDAEGAIGERARHRRQELDEEFETEFQTRIVRDVAPGKVVVCVSFSLNPRLIRYMQGDFAV